MGQERTQERPGPQRPSDPCPPNARNTSAEPWGRARKMLTVGALGTVSHPWGHHHAGTFSRVGCLYIFGFRLRRELWFSYPVNLSSP